MARRIQSIEINGNIYFTSQLGVQKLEGPTASFLQAGLPKALDFVLDLGGGGNWLATGRSVAYRILWGIRDKNFNYVYSPPSQRMIIFNPGAANSVNLFSATVAGFAIPAGLTTDHFFQVYRTKSLLGNQDPGDEMYLCYERNPTNLEIANSLVQNVTDLTADEMLGAALYTNSTQEGNARANYRPPFCTDIANYKDHAIFGNTKDVQRFQINMVGTNVAMNGNSVIINGITFTGSTAAENIAGGVWFVETASTPAVNVDTTARSLVRVINGFPGNAKIYAYYVSEFSEVPGKIVIESRFLGDAPWYTKVNVAAIQPYFAPQLPIVDNETFKSSDGAIPNSLMSSKQSQPEHVPLIYKFYVGSRLEEIQRVLALRDSVLIIKDSSVYRLVGQTVDNFSISLLDNTVSIVSRDSATILNNSVFALTNQGFVSISDNGVQVMSRKIEYDVIADARAIIGQPTQNDPVAIGHESDRLYICNIYSQDLDKRICYVYNAFSESWTRWLLNANCFTVFEDRIYYGLNNAFGHVLKQRIGYADKTPTFPAEWEFNDPEGIVTIAAINTANNSITATFADGVNWTGYYDTLDRGWIIIDGTRKYFVLSWAGPGQPIFLNTVVGLTIGAKTAYRNIKFDVMYSARHTGNPFELKQWSEVHFDLGTMSAFEYDLDFYNELSAKDEPISSQFLAPIKSVNVPLHFNDFDSSTLNANYIQHNKERMMIGNDAGQSAELLVQIRNQTAGSRLEIKGIMILTRSMNTYRTTIGDTA